MLYLYFYIILLTYLGNNQLTGSVPSSVGQLIHLMVLSFWNNQTNGSTPENLGNLKNLTGLDLSENFISGRIPSQFQYLARLQNLNLSPNNLSSTIPPDGFLNLHNTEMVPKPHYYSSLFFLYPLPCFLPVQSSGFSFIFGRRKKKNPLGYRHQKWRSVFGVGL